jgi:hypothetical protein
MRRDCEGEVKNTKEQLEAIRLMATTINDKNPGPAWQIMLELVSDIDELEAENERLRREMKEFIEAYAPDFFDEPSDFKPKIDMNSAAIVRRTLNLILKTPPCEHDFKINDRKLYYCTKCHARKAEQS